MQGQLHAAHPGNSQVPSCNYINDHHQSQKYVPVSEICPSNMVRGKYSVREKLQGCHIVGLEKKNRRIMHGKDTVRNLGNEE